jgi:hypothetical protein
MLEIKKFMSVAFEPEDDSKNWLEGAAEAVEYVIANSESEDIILYATTGRAYIYSVLAPLGNLTSLNMGDIATANISTERTWAIEHCSGGGEPDRIYLSSPLDNSSCELLVRGEKLVFRRCFYGVDENCTRTEISQRLIHALELYWVDEESAYCRLDEDGDVEPVIRLINVKLDEGEKSDVIVTINAHQLHRYMAVTDMALVMKFDFTRCRTGEFSGWSGSARRKHQSPDLFYHSEVQSHSSFVNGILVVRPYITKESMIAENQRQWRGEGKQYATFKAHDWKNERYAEISCAPKALASYFEKDSALPFQITPAFFKPEVLQRYKADPDKYTLEHRSISSRAGWYLKTYDVNDVGQVHTYLRYLADLPYSEQLYWQAFNEWPKAPISQRAYQTDFEGSFSTIIDPLIILKSKVAELDTKRPDWWLPRGDSFASSVHYPLTTSTEEWANAILGLDQLIVEGISPKAIKVRLNKLGHSFDTQWGSIKLLQEYVLAKGMTISDSVLLVEPLKKLHFLRSKVKGHATGAEKKALVKAARMEHGSLAAHFKHLSTKCQESFFLIVEQLST